MKQLIDYVLSHTERGECKCGKCVDVGNKPDPAGHTVDMIFFKVALKNNPNKEEFERLTKDNVGGEFTNVDVFDGQEHNYIELGAWIGDQGLAFQFMAMGTLLGVFDLLTPVTVMGLPSSSPITQHLAGSGLVVVRKKH